MARPTGQDLYALYATRFAYRHPLPSGALHEHERRLWSSLAGDRMGVEDALADPIVESRPCGGDSDITLTTIGSRGVNVRVEDSPMRDAHPGDRTIWLELFDGPLAVTFTTSEAAWLVGQLNERSVHAQQQPERSLSAVGGTIGLIEQFDREIRDRQAEDSERRSGSRLAALTASFNWPILGA